jgi:hypothetical protein
MFGLCKLKIEKEIQKFIKILSMEDTETGICGFELVPLDNLISFVDYESKLLIQYFDIKYKNEIYNIPFFNLTLHYSNVLSGKLLLF